ncbi:hypothetical protein H5395_14315 [Paracoccus sp. MC1854]|uniref:hypothetical protein n=1 Tax=Paracoccus sp. MC1854 TaxID=2760306 RepID=UPI00160013CC|nr:hypothetical protein [Paracoccus sp. MC1854]MBB1492684.1 hypothetical protein [Paracoccus sp. MC1854]
MGEIRDRLNQVLGRDQPGSSKRHQKNLEKDSERERQRKIEMEKPYKKNRNFDLEL